MKPETIIPVVVEHSAELKALHRKARVHYKIYSESKKVEDGITWMTFVIQYSELLKKETNQILVGPKLWDVCK